MSTSPHSETKPPPKPEPVVSKLERTDEEYILDRVQYKINQYTNKARRYRLLYWVMAGGTAIISAIVPALLNIDHPYIKAWAAGLSALVVMLVALQGVFHPREIWRNYDLISSVLREEEMRFSTRSGIYSAEGQQADEQVFRRFVERVEEAIAKERAETIVMRTATSEPISSGK